MKSLILSIIGVCLLAAPSINWRHKIFISIFFGSVTAYSISRDWRFAVKEQGELEQLTKEANNKINAANEQEVQLKQRIESETSRINELESQVKIKLAVDETNSARDIESKLQAAEKEAQRILSDANSKALEKQQELEIKESELETKKQLLERELVELKASETNRINELENQSRVKLAVDETNAKRDIENRLKAAEAEAERILSDANSKVRSEKQKLQAKESELAESGNAIISKAEKQAEDIISKARAKADKLEVDKREEFLSKESELQIKIANFEADLLKLNQEKSSLKEQLRNTQIEYDRITAEARIEAGKLRESIISEINNERERFNKQQALDKANYQKEKHDFELWRIQTGAELEKDRALFDAHAKREQALIDQSKAAWLKEKEELRVLWQQECQEEMNAAVDEEVENKLEAQLRAKMQPHIQEMSRLKNVIDELKQRLAAKERDLEELRSPQFFKDTTPESAHANRLIEFYWRRNLGLNGVARYWKEKYFVVVVEPFEGVTRKKIKNLFDAAAWEFKLAEPPSINVSSEGYEISMLPLPQPFMGAKPPIYEEDVVRALNTDYAIHQPEHLNYDYSEVNNQISLEQKKEQMLSFIPPDRLPSGKGQILPIEYTIVEWYCKWHKAATGQPNITRINDLINMAYGVKVGRSSEAQDPASGYTLRQRIHKILEDLGIKQNECK